MIRAVVCSAPGKIIITGEHSVVYGEPALLASLGLRTKAVIKPYKRGKIRLSSDRLGGLKEEDPDRLKNNWKKAKEIWKKFDKSGDDGELNNLRSDAFVVMKCSVGLSLEKFGKFDNGLDIKLNSDLPMISGFGSSAYVAAVIIGGLVVMSGKKLSLGKLNKQVYEVEKIIHGRPSGGDSTIVVYGDFIKFQKINSEFKFQKIKMRKNLMRNIFLINSGKAIESTGEMVVSIVGEKVKQSKKSRKNIKEIGKLSKLFIKGLEKGKFEYELLKENERLLEELGVVGEKAKRIVRLIEERGGIAKICGGGGIKRGSGVLLAFHKNPSILNELIEKEGWENFKTDLGGEGWRIE